jgi:hypothetical protein
MSEPNTVPIPAPVTQNTHCTTPHHIQHGCKGCSVKQATQKENLANVFYIVRSMHDRRSIVTLFQLIHHFHISVLQLLQGKIRTNYDIKVVIQIY